MSDNILCWSEFYRDILYHFAFKKLEPCSIPFSIVLACLLFKISLFPKPFLLDSNEGFHPDVYVGH